MGNYEQGWLPSGLGTLRNREFLRHCVRTRIGSPAGKRHFLSLGLCASTWAGDQSSGWFLAYREAVRESFEHSTVAGMNGMIKALSDQERVLRTKVGGKNRYLIVPGAPEIDLPPRNRDPREAPGGMVAPYDELALRCLRTVTGDWRSKTLLLAMATITIAVGHEDATLLIERERLGELLEQPRMTSLDEAKRQLRTMGFLDWETIRGPKLRTNRYWFRIDEQGREHPAEHKEASATELGPSRKRRSETGASDAHSTVQDGTTDGPIHQPKAESDEPSRQSVEPPSNGPTHELVAKPHLYLHIASTTRAGAGATEEKGQNIRPATERQVGMLCGLMREQNQQPNAASYRKLTMSQAWRRIDELKRRTSGAGAADDRTERQARRRYDAGRGRARAFDAAAYEEQCDTGAEEPQRRDEGADEDDTVADTDRQERLTKDAKRRYALHEGTWRQKSPPIKRID